MRARAALAGVVALLLAACAGRGGHAVGAPSPSLTPWGLPRAEQALRDAMAAGAWEDAVARATEPARGAPSDPLLRALYEGSAAYYAGRLDASAAAFERAATLAEERETWRVSRGAAALAAGDRALPYVPGEHERLLAHQYAMLARLRAGDAEGAAVEARRLDALLQRLDAPRDRGEREVRAMARLLGGVAFELAGERTDAEVAYRNARALGVADSIARCTHRAGRDGEVVVVLERGFVAHRVDTRLRVRTDADGAAGFAALADGLGALLAARLSADQGVWSDAAADVIPLDDEGDGTVRRARRAGLLTLAWPAYRRPEPLAPLVPADAASPFVVAADLSEALAADLRRDRAGMLARLVARAAVRQAVVGEARRRVEPLGDLLATLGRAVERADTRSWHLLPARVEVVRLRLPAGPRPLLVEVAGQQVELGVVDVPAGGMVLHTARLWDGARPAMLATGGI